MQQIVTDGGMTCLKELPGQEDTPLKWKYFDQFRTYAPGAWFGSRRLTKEERLLQGDSDEGNLI